ncbi:DMT family transporter [Infirmifilum lucidum]|uniref:DMT family transporter n=1 Tax=Infirmifilum lucidum TaxID=2776706 RepID=A0A7L9FI50_9CREN|nr:DMT family transporter [Infirmifilum lucidum]QOJ79042.1 DMT family transporter [Infirmifilum lucidum]
MLWSLFALAAALLFALAGVLYRKGVSGSSISPLLASGLRAGPAFMVMLLAFLATGGSLDRPLEFYAIATASALSAFFVGDSLFIYGLSQAPVGVVYPVAYTYPLFVALFSFLFTGKAPRPASLVAAALMAAGTWAVYGNGGGFAVRGLLAGVGAGAGWGLGITLASLALKYASPVELNLYRTGFLLAATAPVLAKQGARLGEARLGWLLLGGLLGIGLGPLALFTSIKMSDAVGPAVVSSGAPVFAVLLAAPLLGERVEPRYMLGAVLATVATAVASAWG